MLLEEMNKKRSEVKCHSLCFFFFFVKVNTLLELWSLKHFVLNVHLNVTPTFCLAIFFYT